LLLQNRHVNDRIVSIARAFLLPTSDHAHDIPILKEAKAEYAKLL
jgi:hypothetical protein